MLNLVATLARLSALGVSFVRPAEAARLFPPAQAPFSVQHQQVAAPHRAHPNVVFILTDDQDVHLGSLSYQPLVKKHLIDEGLTLQRHFCTVALCCPSRVNLWTGRAAHNTNVTDISPPYGGYPKFVAEGLNEKYLPVWLQQAGYNTYYTGKLFNAHSVDNYNAPYPAGFTGSDFLLDPYTYQYLNSTWQRNQDEPISYKNHYTTDVLIEKANGFLNDAVEAGSPFFLTIAPVAPHSNVEFNGNVLDVNLASLKSTPPISAERHKNLFKDVKIPRTANFNPEEPSGVNWIRRLERQNQTQVDYNDHFYRSRLRALQAIDELVDGVVKRLERYGIIDNTYIFYTSDNGYHIGQHRLPPGKECGYEEDVNIPLIVRGPGIAKGSTSNQVTSHTDLVPTIFNILGLTPRDDFDGSPIPLTENEISEAADTRREHVNLEYWGFAVPEGEYGFEQEGNLVKIQWNNTYKAVRVVSDQYNLYYSVWCNNEHELYDLTTDPYQIHNIYPSPGRTCSSSPLTRPSTILGFPLSKVIARLDALLLVLKSCKGSSCVAPWHVLHPDGDVFSLEDALASTYDEFYEQEQVKVEFSRCEAGHLLDAEGPQQAHLYRHGLRWSELT